MAKRLKVIIRPTDSRQGLNLLMSTLTIGGSVVGLIVSRQIGQLITTAGTVPAIMAQGATTGTTLCPMVNQSTSGMRATAHHGAEEVAEGETGSLGDLAPTMPPEDVVVQLGEVVAKGSKQLTKILPSRDFRPESGDISKEIYLHIGVIWGAIWGPFKKVISKLQ